MAAGKKTGGRGKGTPNKKTAEMIARAEASGLMPHEFLLSVCRGEAQADGYVPTFEDRMEAAKAVVGYYAPKLASIEASSPEGGPLHVVFSTSYEERSQ